VRPPQHRFGMPCLRMLGHHRRHTSNETCCFCLLCSFSLYPPYPPLCQLEAIALIRANLCAQPNKGGSNNVAVARLCAAIAHCLGLPPSPARAALAAQAAKAALDLHGATGAGALAPPRRPRRHAARRPSSALR